MIMYLVLIIISFIVINQLQGKLRNFFILPKYNKKEVSNKNGKEIAEEMLAYYKVNGIKVENSYKVASGYLLVEEKIVLEDKYYRGKDILSMALALHEVGHALQHKEDYTPLTILITTKGFLLRFFSFALTPFMIVLSLLSHFFFPSAIILGITLLLYGFSVIKYSLTRLRAEYNASKRAFIYLEDTDKFTPKERKQIKLILSIFFGSYILAIPYSFIV